MTHLDTAEEYGLICQRAGLLVVGFVLMWMVILLVSDREVDDE